MRNLKIAILLWAGMVLEFGVAPHLPIASVAPGFLLMMIAVLCGRVNRPGAAALGFFGGLALGAMAGADLAHYVLSTCVTAFVVCTMKPARDEADIRTTMVFVAAATVASRLIFMLTAPPPSLAPYLGDTIAQAVYNGVLAAPIFAIVNLTLGKERRRL